MVEDDHEKNGEKWTRIERRRIEKNRIKKNYIDHVKKQKKVYS